MVWLDFFSLMRHWRLLPRPILRGLTAFSRNESGRLTIFWSLCTYNMDMDSHNKTMRFNEIVVNDPPP